MTGLESQEEDDPKRILFFKPMSWLGQIRTHRRDFQLDPLGDHLNTCTTHSGAKKAHDWMVDQLADLFHTSHKVKTQQVVKNLLTFFTHRIRLKHSRWLKTEVIIVETLR
jgi:hypothetical protein